MTPTPPRFDLRTGTIWMSEDGIVRILLEPRVTTEMAEAEATLEASRQLVGAHRAPMLVVVGAASGATREVRRMYAGARPLLYHNALAILVGSPLARVLGNFFLTIDRPMIPCRMFDDEGDAIAWLKAQPCP